MSFSHHLLRVASASSCGALSPNASSCGALSPNNIERFSVLPVACTLGWHEHDVPCREAELQAPATPTSLCTPSRPSVSTNHFLITAVSCQCRPCCRLHVHQASDPIVDLCLHLQALPGPTCHSHTSKRGSGSSTTRRKSAWRGLGGWSLELNLTTGNVVPSKCTRHGRDRKRSTCLQHAG